jgi:hypothetical protein
MKTFLVVLSLSVSFSCFSQNNDINRDYNPPENNNPIALNTGNLPDIQVYNQNKAQQVAIPQMPKQVQANNFQMVINTRNRSLEGVSERSSRMGTKQVKKISQRKKHQSFDLFDKLFDKKFKKVHHYKKKGRIRKCASFS